MRKKLILLVLALVAVAATSAITPASATKCPPPQIQVHCDGLSRLVATERLQAETIRA